MMHVKRSIVLSLAGLGAGFVLPAVAAAGPTGAHVPTSSVSVRAGMNRGLFEGPPLRGETPRLGDNVRVKASPVQTVEPPSPTTVIARPYAIAPRLFSQFWYGRSSLGEFSGQCANTVADPPFIGSATVPNPFLSTSCFRGAFFNGEYDPRTPLVPGRNKDALYGRAYDPDVNSFE